jgi:protein-tyrosine phosphatase
VIEHFGEMEPWLTRGAQPANDEYLWLRSRGVDTLVNLRRSDDSLAVESYAPEVLQIRIAVPDDCPPSHEQAVKWLRFCDEVRSRRRLYVHCRNGSGRTSVFCALVRIGQGWGAASAIDEQRPFGFGAPKHCAQVDFLRQFAAANPSMQRG